MTDLARKRRERKNQMLTEACPKMRQRIRRDFIPEFGAWLLLWGQRYEHQKRTLSTDPKLRDLESSRQAIAWCNNAIRVIESLITGLWDTVPRHEWDQVCDELRAEMEKIRTTGATPLEPGEQPT